jgi:hypothetical protein
MPPTGVFRVNLNEVKDLTYSTVRNSLHAFSMIGEGLVNTAKKIGSP